MFKKELVPHVSQVSATQLREAVEEIDSVDFRKGVEWVLSNRPSLTYPTIDVVVPHPNLGRVILAKKADEDEWRFPGVFFNPGMDADFEAAAVRAMAKEVPTLRVQSPQIVKSFKIDDWRYRKSRDGIITLLVKMPYSGTGEPSPGLGVAEARWFNYSDVVPELLVCEHRVLGEYLGQRHFS